MKDTNQRLFIAIALWLGLLLGGRAIYTTWFEPKQGRVPVRPAASAPAAAAAASADKQGQALAVASGKGPDVPRGTSPRGETKKVTFQTSRAQMTITSDGAAVEHIQLRGEKFTRHKGQKEETQVDLVAARAGEPLPFSTVLKNDAGAIVLPADAAWEVVAQSPLAATFRAEASGLTVEKTFTVEEGSYRIGLQVRVQAAQGFKGQLLVLSGTHADEPAGGLFGSRSNLPARTICAAGTKTERVAVGAKTPIWEGQGALFTGIDEQYFLTAVAPPDGVPASCRLEAVGEKSGSLISTLSLPLQLAAGASSQLALTGYAGPKDTGELALVGKAFQKSVDWGFWSVIAELLLGVMRFFQRIIPGHNWGVAIILLTLSMKALTFPLQHKSMKSMQEMQRIQPQLEEMKKKFAGDTQRQNLEQMKLFKEHGVNPMGSCLPMVIQMPIWFALYTTLQVSVELYNAPFIHGWLEDLTSKDPYYVLPVAMGITMILTQVLTPTPMSNPGQKTMGYVMSGFFSLLMLTLPSGLTLYIFTNNLLSIAQQMYLRRTMKLPTPPASGQTVEASKKGGEPGAPRAKLRA